MTVLERFYVISNKKINFLALSYPNNTINQTLLPPILYAFQPTEVTVDWDSDVCLLGYIFSWN